MKETGNWPKELLNEKQPKPGEIILSFYSGLFPGLFKWANEKILEADILWKKYPWGKKFLADILGLKESKKTEGATYLKTMPKYFEEKTYEKIEEILKLESRKREINKQLESLKEINTNIPIIALEGNEKALKKIQLEGELKIIEERMEKFMEDFSR